MKKFIGYIFIFIVAVGLFSPLDRASAQIVKGTCAYQATNKTTGATRQFVIQDIYESACINQDTPSETWVKLSFNVTGVQQTTATPQDADKTAFKKALDSRSCSFSVSLGETWSPIEGCLRSLAYILFFSIPAGILTVVGALFNGILTLAISTKLYGGGFIESAWTVVRDISNVFFILILLYIAIQMILGLGGHDQKKMIGWVVVMALLINFSMLFTKVVIDSSNILALVFYNKITIEQKSGAEAYQSPINSTDTGITAKDISGNLVGAFNITQMMRPALFDKTVTVFGRFGEPLRDSTSLMITIILIAGAIMLIASYAFFMAGLAFMGRLVELWILIIFSPFAFMSFPVPKLKSVDGIGWSKWIDQLLGTAFMAPIFMFFMYLIARISSGAKLFGDKNTATMSFLEMLLVIIIPSMIYIILLMKATDYAEKGGGQLGKLAIGVGKASVGLIAGGAIGGVALAGRSTVGAFMKGASTGDTLAGRVAENRARMAENNLRIADPRASLLAKTQARINNITTGVKVRAGNLQERTGYAGIQRGVGNLINNDQRNVTHAKHARHELDTAAGAVAHGKKWEDLNGEERFATRRKMARDDTVRRYATGTIIDPATGAPAVNPATGAPVGNFGNRKWEGLTNEEREVINSLIGAGDHDTAVAGGALATNTTVADQFIRDARRKQGVVSTAFQSTVGGTYDARNLANIIAGEQTTAINKLTVGLTSAFTKSFRAGFSTAGINFGKKPEGEFFKDLGATISESLKSANIKIDLSSVGAEAKESGGSHGGGHTSGGGHGGGGGGHH